MNTKGCLKVPVFLVLIPVVFILPPLWFAVFAFIAFTMYFYRTNRP